MRRCFCGGLHRRDNSNEVVLARCYQYEGAIEEDCTEFVCAARSREKSGEVLGRCRKRFGTGKRRERRSLRDVLHW